MRPAQLSSKSEDNMSCKVITNPSKNWSENDYGQFWKVTLPLIEKAKEDNKTVDFQPMLDVVERLLTEEPTKAIRGLNVESVPGVIPHCETLALPNHNCGYIRLGCTGCLKIDPIAFKINDTFSKALAAGRTAANALSLVAKAMINKGLEFDKIDQHFSNSLEKIKNLDFENMPEVLEF